MSNQVAQLLELANNIHSRDRQIMEYFERLDRYCAQLRRKVELGTLTEEERQQAIELATHLNTTAYRMRVEYSRRS